MKLSLQHCLLLAIPIIFMAWLMSYLSDREDHFNTRMDKDIKSFAEQAVAKHMDKDQAALIQSTLLDIKHDVSSYVWHSANMIIYGICIMLIPLICFFTWNRPKPPST